jgi:hypothetical protein
MGLHEIKKLLHSKGNSHQTEEATYRMGENLCSYTSDKGLISRIYREVRKPTLQRINSPLNKRANELSRQFSKKYKWPINVKKCSHPWP